MLPSEIQIPVSATIIEPDYSKYAKLSDKSLLKQLNIELFKEFITHKSMIIINDHHRSTPSNRVLKAIATLISQEKIQHKIEKIVIATGSHTPPNRDQMKKLTGGIEEELSLEVVSHNDKTATFTDFGVTKRGTPVKLNTIIEEYEHIITINSVEPHYFAGFTGGIKSLVPGLAVRETIEANHSWALDPKTAPTKIDSNPLQIDLWEAGMMVNATILGIQLVNFQQDIFHMSVDYLRKAFDQAAQVSKDLYTHVIPQPVDVIVSVIYPPLDRSLYQAQKGIENTRRGLKLGGELILVAKCDEGIGNSKFFDIISNFSTPQDVISTITRETYNFGDHKAYYFAKLSAESTLTIASNLQKEQSMKVFANPLTISQLEDYLRKLAESGKTILIVLDSGSLTILSDTEK